MGRCAGVAGSRLLQAQAAVRGSVVHLQRPVSAQSTEEQSGTIHALRAPVVRALLSAVLGYVYTQTPSGNCVDLGPPYEPTISLRSLCVHLRILLLSRSAQPQLPVAQRGTEGSKTVVCSSSTREQ